MSGTITWKADLAGVWREDREYWLFALRTALGCLLALFLAFRLELQTPSSAAMTVTIIALPQSGYVIEKAFYRLLGTLVGGAVSLLLVALFVQQPETFLVAMACWIGLCTGLSLKMRNFRAYAFVLSGYTAGIIGYPAFIAPDMALQIAVDRVSAVSLGILCATVLNATILPRSATSQLIQVVRRRLPDFTDYARSVLGMPRPRHEVRHFQDRLLHDVVALESIRGASFFEDADSRIRSTRLRRLNSDFMASSTALHAIYRLREDMLMRGEKRLIDALHPLTEQLLGQLETPAGQAPANAVETAPVARAFDAWLRDWPLHAEAARNRFGFCAGAERRELDANLQLLHWFAEDLRDYLNSYAKLLEPRELVGAEARRPASRSDILVVLVSMLRCVMAIVLAGAFWILTGWPDGFYGFILVCVFPGLFAAAPNPLAPVKGVAKGFFVGTLFTVPLYMLVLPRLDGFIELAAAHLPLMLLFGFWIARPETSARGLGALIMLLTGIMVTNPLPYDVAEFLNRIVATFVGFGFVALAYTAFPLPGPAWVTRRLQRLLSRQLRVAARYPVNEARHEFETGVTDLITQLTPRFAADIKARERQVDKGLAVLESGYALIRLRQLGVISAEMLRLIPQAFEDPQYIEAVLERIEQHIQQPPENPNPEIGAALRLLRLGLREWRELSDLAPKPDLEVPHAT